MSALYGELDGAARTTATRRGTVNTGISAHIRGYKRGVYTSIMAVCEGDKRKASPDAKCKFRMTVRTTGGSNNPAEQHEVYTEEWEE